MVRAVFPPCCLTWGQTIVEVMEIMATSFRRSHDALLRSVPPTLQQATTDPRLHWRLLDTHDKSGSVSCGVTAPFSWVLLCTRFCLCPPRVCFPVLCKFWWLYGGIIGDLLQEGLCHTQVCCSQSPCPAAGHCWSTPLQETLRHSSGSVSVGSVGPGVCKVCLSPVSISGRYGVWF